MEERFQADKASGIPNPSISNRLKGQQSGRKPRDLALFQESLQDIP